MLSTKKANLERITFHGKSLNKSSEDDRDIMKSFLQELHWNSIVLDSFMIRNTNLTDDLFLPIANVLKFVKNIYLDGNELTLKSLHSIFKVCLF